MTRQKRYALYYTPPPGSTLATFGDTIFGDGRLPGWSESDRQALAAMTAEPRIYGFHATLKAPMRLAAGATEDDLLQACLVLTEHRQPMSVGFLVLERIGEFIALVPEGPPDALGLFAAECVAALDPLRAPLTPLERARRRPERLDPRRRMLLDRWGYPHVFEAFRFHMTLTASLPADVRESWHARLAASYKPVSLTIDAVTLLCQDGAEPFRVLRRIPFTD